MSRVSILDVQGEITSFFVSNPYKSVIIFALILQLANYSVKYPLPKRSGNIDHILRIHMLLCSLHLLKTFLSHNFSCYFMICYQQLYSSFSVSQNRDFKYLSRSFLGIYHKPFPILLWSSFDLNNDLFFLFLIHISV